MVDETGVTSVDVTNYDTPGHSVEVELSRNGSYADAWWYYDGYETLDALYKSAVTAKLESYNHEDNVDEKLANTTESTNTEQESKHYWQGLSCQYSNKLQGEKRWHQSLFKSNAQDVVRQYQRRIRNANIAENRS